MITHISFARVVLLALSVGASVLAGCRDGQIIVQEYRRVASPDARWEVVLEQIDNGLGFGQGLLVNEIHVQPAGSRVTYHGNESVTCVFWVAASEPPTVEWIAPRRLVVTRFGSKQPGREIARYMDVEIEYRTIDRPI
jgi:hypothetical protein